MVKLSIPQAKALVRKILPRIHKNNDNTRNAIVEEFKKSADYKQFISSTEAILTAINKYVSEYNLFNVGSVYINHCTVYLRDITDSEGIRNAALRLGDCYARDKRVKELNNIKYPTEDDLLDDIILDAVEAEDLQSIIKKYTEQYD